MDWGVLFVIMPKQDLLSIDEKFVENCLDKLSKTNEKLSQNFLKCVKMWPNFLQILESLVIISSKISHKRVNFKKIKFWNFYY
jgi:hypothetical protein